MKCIAIIPARGNSKRIKNKNIKLFNNKPIIYHVIKKLKVSKLFSNIYVSTDSNIIKSVAEKNGALVPFKRSKILSNDYSSSRDVVIDMIKFLNEKNIKFDYVCCIYPTSVFASNLILKKAFKLLLNNQNKFIFGAIPFATPIERGFKLKKNKIYKNMKKKFIKTHTNKLNKTYYDSGQFYFAKKEMFIKKVPVFKKGNIAIKFDNYNCVDINNPEDWKLAEIIYKNL